MSGGTIRDDVAAFVVQYIESIVDVELLMLVSQGPGTAWTADGLARELRVEPAWAASEVRRFTVLGLLTETEGCPRTYRYTPRTPALQGAVAGLIDAYRQRRVSVINLVYGRPSDAIRSFADAFRLRKD